MLGYASRRVTFKEPVQSYWLYFADTNHPIRFMLKRNYTHVAVLTNDGKQWMILDPTNNQLRVQVLNYAITDDVPSIYIKSAYRVIKVNMYPMDYKRQRKRLGVMSCVSHTCYIMGLKIKALTPYALFKKLLKLRTDLNKDHGVQSVVVLK